MTTLGIVGLVIALAFASKRKQQNVQPLWSRQWRGWQKIFCLAGFIAALLIVINPEFLAFGILGDAAFFDMLVLALSLQFQSFAMRAWHQMREVTAVVMALLIRSFRRDVTTLSVTLALAGERVLEIGKRISRLVSLA